MEQRERLVSTSGAEGARGLSNSRKLDYCRRRRREGVHVEGKSEFSHGHTSYLRGIRVLMLAPSSPRTTGRPATEASTSNPKTPF